MKSLLGKAVDAFEKRFPGAKVEHALFDETKRRFAYVAKDRHTGEKGFLAAKGSMKGTTVSIHRELFDMMKLTGMPLVLALKSGDHFNFYRFRSQEIAVDCWENLRDGITMVNFNLKHGTSLQREKEKA